MCTLVRFIIVVRALAGKVGKIGHAYYLNIQIITSHNITLHFCHHLYPLLISPTAPIWKWVNAVPLNLHHSKNSHQNCWCLNCNFYVCVTDRNVFLMLLLMLHAPYSGHVVRGEKWLTPWFLRLTTWSTIRDTRGDTTRTTLQPPPVPLSLCL